jgi:hypothetical protein
MGTVLGLLIPLWIALGAAAVGIAWLWRQLRDNVRAAARDVYPGSARHRAALNSVDQRTAPAFTAWRQLPTATQAALDEAAIAAHDHTAAAAEPGPPR